MIARWQLKAVTAAIKGIIPFQGTLRRAKRRLFPYQTDSAIDRGLLADGLQILSELQAAGSNIEGSVVLEIGSGWHPVIPLLFHLAGARRVWMTDQVHLMDHSLVASAIQLIRRSSTELLANDLRLPDGWPSSLDRGVRDFDSMLEALRLDYSVPFDIKALGNHSIDVLVSRAVLEHIQPNVVASLFSEFQARPQPQRLHVPRHRQYGSLRTC